MGVFNLTEVNNIIKTNNIVNDILGLTFLKDTNTNKYTITFNYDNLENESGSENQSQVSESDDLQFESIKELNYLFEELINNINENEKLIDIDQNKLSLRLGEFNNDDVDQTIIQDVINNTENNKFLLNHRISTKEDLNKILK